jgi:ribosomal protein S18 acetylase RimI-like enzyme
VIDRGQAGEGLGGQLLDRAEDRTRQAGRRFLRLDCAADNERLRGCYRERGFVELGRREFRDWGPVCCWRSH